MNTTVKSHTQPFDPFRMQDEAILYEEIYPGLEWWVRYQGSIWRARLIEKNTHLTVNDIVYVLRRYGSVLVIQSVRYW